MEEDLSIFEAKTIKLTHKEYTFQMVRNTTFFATIITCGVFALSRIRITEHFALLLLLLVAINIISIFTIKYKHPKIITLNEKSFQLTFSLLGLSIRKQEFYYFNTFVLIKNNFKDKFSLTLKSKSFDDIEFIGTKDELMLMEEEFKNRIEVNFTI